MYFTNVERAAGNVYATVKDAKGDTICIYIKEVSGSHAHVTMLRPEPAFEGQRPSQKLSMAKEPIPGIEAVHGDGWFEVATCVASASLDGR